MIYMLVIAIFEWTEGNIIYASDIMVYLTCATFSNDFIICHVIMNKYEYMKLLIIFKIIMYIF